MYKFLIITLFSILALSCAKEVELEKAQDYYEHEGNKLAAVGKYKDATEWYEQALIRAESPEYAAKIQLLLADSYYLAEMYEEAIPVYEVYLDIYKDLYYAKLARVRLGLSYFNLVKYASRDQTNTIKSLEAFMYVKEHYPELVKDYRIDERIYLLRERLAKKEWIIGNYYSRILKPKSARNRYKYIMDNYKDTKYYEVAIMKYVPISLKMDELSDAIDACNDLSKNKPSSKKINKCNKLITKYEKKQEKLEKK